MSWQVVGHTTIYRDKSWYAAHPNLVRTPSGELLVLFHRCPVAKSYTHKHPLFDMRACRSTDEGVTWSEARLVTTDPRGGILDMGTHTLGDGSIFLHCSNVELVPANPPHNTNGWTARRGLPFWVRSRDDGRTWSEPERFPPLLDAVWGHPATHSGVCRSGLVSVEGRLLLPSKATDNPDGSFPYFGMLRVSTDLGNTWEYGGRIVEDPEHHFSEPAIHLTPGGRLIVLYRWHPDPGRMRAQPSLALVTSDDGGDTWSRWKPTNIQGSPAHILGLRDERMLVTVGTRWEGRRGCTARVVDPEGTDLESTPEVVIRSDSIDGDCGYPWAVQLEDGRVLVVYYYVHPDGVRGIEATTLEER